MILCTSASGGVHTGLFKCTVKCIWSALETSLCVRVLFPWLILTFFATETSKPQGAEVRSQVRSKRSLRLNLSNQSIRRLLSKCQSSRATNSTLASENRFLNEDCWSPRNVGGFFSVLIHELVQKVHDFLFTVSIFYCISFEILRLPRTEQGHPNQFLENICSEDDLRSRIFGTCVVKFLACLLLLGFLNI